MIKKSWLSSFLYTLWLLAVAIGLWLLYWSSLLQEEKLQKLTLDVNKLEKMVKEGIEFAPGPHMLQAAPVSQEVSYPGNLLHQDPYYMTTLPKLLGPSFRPHGTLRLGTLGRADNLHPFSEWGFVLEWMSYVQRGLFGLQFGKYTAFSPEIALALVETDDPEHNQVVFTAHLRKGVLWQPLQQAHFSEEIALGDHFLQKHLVTAHDFQFFFQALNNTHVDVASAVTLRQLLSDITSVEAVDDYTLKIVYKKTAVTDANGNTTFLLPYNARLRIGMIQPLARFVYQYGANGEKLCEDDTVVDFYRKSSVWAQHLSHHFALGVIPSCGPYMFDGASDRMIRFKRNPDFYEPLQALYEAIEVNIVETPDAIWRDFMAQKIDVCTLPAQSVVEFEKFKESDFCMQQKKLGHEVNTVEYLGRSFSYLAFNFKKPFFSSRKVRQALSMAVDYNRLIHQNLYDQAVPISGPFFKESTAYDATILEWPYDVEAAKRLLAEEGWYDSDGDGIIDKEIDGVRVPFRFSLHFYIKNPISKAYCQMVSGYYRAIGIDCRLQGVDIADLTAVFEDKSFDSLFMAWQLSAPPEDPDQLWNSKGAYEKGSSNMIGFVNHEVDELIQKLKFEQTVQDRMRLYHRVHEILHDEAPYLYLYTPKVTMAYWSWIKNLIIPKDHQDLIPQADVVEPSPLSTWKE